MVISSSEQNLRDESDNILKMVIRHLRLCNLLFSQ